MTTLSSSLRFAASAFVALSLIAPVAGCGSDEAAKKPTEDKPKRRQGPDEAFRKERPAAGELPAVSLPTFQTATLKNGLTLYVVEERGLPLADVRLVVRAGSWPVKPKDAGLVSVTWDMLDEGAGKLDGPGLAEAFAEIGTSLRAGSDYDAGVLATSVLSKNLERAVELIALVAKEPTFDKAAFDKVRARRLSALVGRAGRPSAVAADVLAEGMYGAKHPYGVRSTGTEATLKSLKAKAAKKLWQSVAGPKTAALVFAGDIDLETATALAERHFGKWKSKAKAGKPPAEPAASGTKLYLVPGAPGAPQAVIRFGRPLMANGDPDEVKADVFNTIVGGMFTSRLNMNLREDKAWAYGAFSDIDIRLGKSPWFLGSNVKAPHAADAVGEFLKEFEAIRSAPVSDEELALAKANLMKSLPGKFETIQAMSGAAASLFIYALPTEYFSKLPDQINAVTKEDVLAVAQRAAVLDGMVGVVVGDAESLSTALADSPLGAPILVKDPTAPLPK